jgi:hypothetical protein
MIIEKGGVNPKFMAEEIAAEKKELHPVKALIEGIISLAVSLECLVFPIISLVFTLSYQAAKNGNAVCSSNGGTGHTCSSDELLVLKTGLITIDVVFLILGVAFLVTSLVLGLKAAKYGKEAASEGGKAKVGRILGTVGWIVSLVCLVFVLGASILGFIL